MYCRNCGTKQDDNASFCNHCGAPLNQPETKEKVTPDTAPKVEPKKKLSKKAWIIIVVAIMVLAIGGTVAGVIVSQNRKEEVNASIDESDYDNSEPITGFMLVNTVHEDKEHYYVKKEGNNYVLYAFGERASNFNGPAPMTIKKYDKRRQLYMFKNGVFDPSFNGTAKVSGSKEYGTYYYVDGKADIYDPEVHFLTDDNDTSYYYKYSQLQSHFSGTLHFNDPDTGESFEEIIENGRVVGMNDANGYVSFE